VAYVSNETSVDEVYIRRFSGARGSERVSKAGGVNPRWRPDGKALFYIGPGHTLVEVEVEIGDAAKVGARHTLFPLGVDQCGYAVLPGGNRFVACHRVDPPSAEIVIVVNWASGMRPH